MAFVLGSLAVLLVIYLSLRFPNIRTAALIFLGLAALGFVLVGLLIYFEK